MRPYNHIGRSLLVCAGAVAVALVLAGCATEPGTSDIDKIRFANATAQAASFTPSPIPTATASPRPPATSTPKPAVISAFDLRPGDCFDYAPANKPTPVLKIYEVPGTPQPIIDDLVLKVTVYACNGPGPRYQLLDQTSYPGGTQYPGAGYYSDLADEKCPAKADFYLFPTELSWSRGDRLVSCIQKLV